MIDAGPRAAAAIGPPPPIYDLAPGNNAGCEWDPGNQYEDVTIGNFVAYEHDGAVVVAFVAWAKHPPVYDPAVSTGWVLAVAKFDALTGNPRGGFWYHPWDWDEICGSDIWAYRPDLGTSCYRDWSLLAPARLFAWDGREGHPTWIESADPWDPYPEGIITTGKVSKDPFEWTEAGIPPNTDCGTYCIRTAGGVEYWHDSTSKIDCRAGASLIWSAEPREFWDACAAPQGLLIAGDRLPS